MSEQSLENTFDDSGYENDDLFADVDSAPGETDTPQLYPELLKKFLKRSFIGLDVESLSPEDIEAIFSNIPTIVRAPGFRHSRIEDREKWLESLYLWVRGLKPREIADNLGGTAESVYRDITRLGRHLSGQRRIEQVIKGELPEVVNDVGSTALNGANGRKKAMTSAEFWSSPILPEKPTGYKARSRRSKGSGKSPVDGLPRDKNDTPGFEVVRLPSLDRPKPMPEGQKPADLSALRTRAAGSHD